jgi:hypothetical protein
MKRCPTCNRTYTDANLSFCIDDGTPLIAVPSSEDEMTAVSPSSSRSGDPLPSGGYTPRDWNAPAYQPPSSYVPPGSTKKRRVWPWVLAVVGVLAIGIVGLGIVAAIVIPKIMDSASNRNSGSYNSNQRTENLNSNPESNSNTSNSNHSENTNIANDNSAPPTDKADVLSVLTDIEHEWTVANINADKKALDRILADDYVATNLDGTTVGKVEYISTIQRDNETQKWEFQDLRVDLKGNRATLTGVIKYQLRSGERSFQFTDTFVWRDGRWQATASELKEIPRATT